MASLLCAPAAARAFEWSSLWLNDDQRAARQMQRAAYSRAAETFNDAAWRAAAWYRAGEYGKAAQAWSRLDGIEAHYNRGNALARAGRLQEAAAAYETVLERDPDHADARHNLAVIREHMQDSRNQSEESQQDDENRDTEPQQNDRQGQQGQQGRQQQKDRSGGQPDAPRQRSQEQADQSGEEAPPPQQAERNQADEPGQRSGGEPGAQSPPQQAGQREAGDTLPEQRAATEQWLRRIPDDPGGLLRRKFRYQYSQRRRGEGPVEEPW